MYILLGTLASCADIINAVIDNTGVNIQSENFYLWFTEDRKILQQNIEPGTDIKSLIDNSEYKSLETYYQKIKIEPSDKKYFYITVDNTSEKALNWTYNRTKSLFPEHGLSSPAKLRNNNLINMYYADKIIKLEDILDGKLIDILKEFIDTPLDERLYNTYLSLLLEDYPFD